jgi:hypothetical protein
MRRWQNIARLKHAPPRSLISGASGIEHVMQAKRGDVTESGTGNDVEHIARREGGQHHGIHINAPAIEPRSRNHVRHPPTKKSRSHFGFGRSIRL